jgi:hypothetical protein
VPGERTSTIEIIQRLLAIAGHNDLVSEVILLQRR